MPDCTVGVDISKAHLDVYLAPVGKAVRFTNDAAGFNALIAWIDRPVRSVVYEPTGPWHRAFEEVLLQAGLPLARANPLQARRFAQAMGQRAKTDTVDARMLAQMGAALHLRPTTASPPPRRALEELQVARDALVQDRTAARNRQKHLRHRLLKQQNKTRLSQIDRHLAADTPLGNCGSPSSGGVSSAKCSTSAAMRMPPSPLVPLPMCAPIPSTSCGWC